MAPKPPLKVVLCWHMHQPDYRDHIRDEFLQPWVYLHAIKDYVDMAAHLEAVPEAKAVINFSPVLLEQLDIYERQLDGYINNSTPIRDSLLAALDMPVFPSDIEHRIALVKSCLRANRKNSVERFDDYKKLVQLAELVIHDVSSGSYLSNQYLADLVTWYHLVWLGETVRSSNNEVKKLIRQGSGFTLHQRRGLLKVIAGLISSLRSRYTNLVDNGQLELSMSPYAHPMLPLLIQFDVAQEALPDIHLPMFDCYPGGEKRTNWHLQHGQSVFENYFGLRPQGCWPSEGGISIASMKSIYDAGFKWAATGEGVLRNSLRQAAREDSHSALYHAYREQTSGLQLFARDDTLSDLIGFTYADWHADDAVADLIQRLESIALKQNEDEQLIVSIILDGENAWEYYPENANYFLPALYRGLADHPQLQLSTFSELIESVCTHEIHEITSGSWVYGNFSTWIGNEDKNRAWDILADVKRVYDEVLGRAHITPAQQQKIDVQLAACEGSDWFWWFGDYNPAETVSDFESLFRLHLANLYHMLGQESPQYLSQTLSHGSGSPRLGGVIRPGSSQ